MWARTENRGETSLPISGECSLPIIGFLRSDLGLRNPRDPAHSFMVKWAYGQMVIYGQIKEGQKDKPFSTPDPELKIRSFFKFFVQKLEQGGDVLILRFVKSVSHSYMQTFVLFFWWKNLKINRKCYLYFWDSIQFWLTPQGPKGPPYLKRYWCLRNTWQISPWLDSSQAPLALTFGLLHSSLHCLLLARLLLS